MDRITNFGDTGGRSGKKVRLIADIWSAFPGFSYRELLQMDCRDVRLWLRQAQRLRAINQIDAVQAASAPYMKSEDIRDMLRKLHHLAMEVETEQQCPRATPDEYRMLQRLAGGLVS